MVAPVGREGEVAAAAAFVAAIGGGPAVLDVAGDAGIGKSTLVRHVVEVARAAGVTVLEARPGQGEVDLGFSGLTDLLRDVGDDELATLASPQRLALSAATLREPAAAADDQDPVLAPRVVATALSSLLHQLVTPGRPPVLIVVDDAQWLDLPSSDALAFALRRLDSGARVGLLVARRPGAEGAAATPVVAAMGGAARSERLLLGGLGSAALFHVVRDRIGVALSRPVLLRITEVAGGNPFFAVELARASVADGPLADRVAVPPSLQGVVAARFDRLEAATHEVLLVVACAGRCDVAELELLVDASEVELAESAGLLELEAGRVTFAHPLLASATLERASSGERRRTHRRLAAVAVDAGARARHLALGTTAPDAAVADALDLAVATALRRGASLTAVELARLALDRTVPDAAGDRWRRRVQLAEVFHLAGDTTSIVELLDGLDGCPAGAARVRGDLLLAEVAFQTTRPERARVHARSSVSAAAELDDGLLEARAHLTLAATVADPDEIAACAAAAVIALGRAAAGARHDELLAWAVMTAVHASFNRGDGLDRGELDRALALERAGREWRSTDQVAAVHPVLCKWADDPEAARVGLVELRARAEEEGNEGLLPYVLAHLAHVLLRLGRVDEAERVAAEGVAMAEASGQASQRAQALYTAALVDAARGRLDEAEGWGHDMLAWADGEDDDVVRCSAFAVLGVTALVRGDVQSARAALDRWAALNRDVGGADPGISRFYGDHVDALLATGDVDAAAAATDELARAADRAGRVSAKAIARRCRAQLEAAAGDLRGALVHLDAALDHHALVVDPLEQARTLLVQGTVHRRAKQKRAARAALEDARDRFVALDAGGWVARADAELARLGRRSAAPLDLTATERRVAELASTGLTNREVAERAFMSPKTVEANLAKAYRKLGISSRAQLGATMARLAGDAP